MNVEGVIVGVNSKVGSSEWIFTVVVHEIVIKENTASMLRASSAPNANETARLSSIKIQRDFILGSVC